MSTQLIRIEAEDWYSECPFALITSVFLTEKEEFGITVSDDYQTDGSDLTIDLEALVIILEEFPDRVEDDVIEVISKIYFVRRE